MTKNVSSSVNLRYLNTSLLPTREALDWVIRKLIPQHEINRITIQSNPISVTSNPTTTIITPTRAFFVKKLNQYWNHELEATITRTLSPMSTTLTYVCANKYHRVIMSDYSASSNYLTAPIWDTVLYRQALYTLDKACIILQNSLVSSAVSLPVMSQIPMCQDHVVRGLRILEENKNLNFLSLLTQKNNQDLTQMTRNALHTISSETLLFPQHLDATPENWLLSATSKTKPQSSPRSTV